MVKIILSGCNGKMGKVISSLSEGNKNISIAAGIDKKNISSNYPVFTSIDNCTEKADVILDFSRPDSLDSLIKYASCKKMGLVLCTTGYTDEQIKQIKTASATTSIFRSANMSIGINVINNILKNVSSLLFKSFDIEILESHHNQKVDSPSGTALMLAESIKSSIDTNLEFVNGRHGIKKRDHNEVGIHSIRGGSIVGEHSIIFAGQGETIEIKHTAISREVFAVGALKACEFMKGKGNGLYSMDDVISSNK